MLVRDMKEGMVLDCRGNLYRVERQEGFMGYVSERGAWCHLPVDEDVHYDFIVADADRVAKSVFAPEKDVGCSPPGTAVDVMDYKVTMGPAVMASDPKAIVVPTQDETKETLNAVLSEYSLRSMRLADECQVLREKLVETMGTVAFQKWEADRGR